MFEKLAAEDLEFMDSDDEAEIPGFGTSTSDYEEVVGPFYAYWQSYCTKKSYAWLCQHNLTEIRDRRLLRHVEKDTKKLAAKAKRERNDEVRALVAFVKKRDRRVVEYRRVLDERAEANRVKQQEKRMEQLRKNRLEVSFSWGFVCLLVLSINESFTRCYFFDNKIDQRDENCVYETQAVFAWEQYNLTK